MTIGLSTGMEFVNHTPFDALAFEGVAANRRRFHVVALKQTLAFDAAGALSLADEQAPLAVADAYQGEANASSVIGESDLCHYKPKCDVLVVGDAYAPDGSPTARFPIRLRVGRASTPRPIPERPYGLNPRMRASPEAEARWREAVAWSAANPYQGETYVDKTLIVTGERVFRKQSGGWTLSDPLPFTRMTLGYEHAFGGQNVLRDAGTGAVTFWELDERNPVGVGFAHPEWLRQAGVDSVEAPRIELADEPLRELGDAWAPQGLGAINKAWMPRRELLGTVDDAFIASDAPLPHDFRSAYWNAAPVDQQMAFPSGDEIVTLINLTPEGETTLALPGDTIYLFVRYDDGDIEAPSMKIDTILIDTTARRVHLTWRAVVVKRPDNAVRVIETRYRDRPTDRELKEGVARRLQEHVVAAEAAEAGWWPDA